MQSKGTINCKPTDFKSKGIESEMFTKIKNSKLKTKQNKKFKLLSFICLFFSFILYCVKTCFFLCVICYHVEMYQLYG